MFSEAEPLPLPDREVHVWGFALDLPPAKAEQMGAWLSEGEKARAAAFHFARDRHHFTAARGQLRELLGRYLDTLPDALRFVVDAQGKPRLAGSFADAGVRFNVSHSHGRALIAVARGCEVGVDLEQIRDDVDCEGIIASHFSPAERAAWATLPEAKRRAAFFHGWTRKESYVKARGEGLSHPPSAYTVSLDPDGAGGLVADTLTPDAPSLWRLESLRAPAGFAAALTYAAPRRSVFLREG
jgi:4'-phosphopantetheinyl transferase